MNNLLKRIREHNERICQRQDVEDALWEGEVKFYGGAAGDIIGRRWINKTSSYNCS